MFETEIMPRVSETDGGRHINNAVIPNWLEAGRRGVFEIFNPDLGFEDWRCVIVNLTVNYVDQLFLRYPVTVRTRVNSIGNTSFVLGEEIVQQDRLCVKGTATYVNFSFANQKAEPLTDEQRAALSRHMNSD